MRNRKDDERHRTWFPQLVFGFYMSPVLQFRPLFFQKSSLQISSYENISFLKKSFIKAMGHPVA
jgi:hypothetical protein